MKKIINIIVLIIFFQIIICSFSHVWAEDDSSYLKIFRINKEGIIPYFDKTIKEYYLTVGTNTNKIEITAVPENENMSVKVFNNDNLKNGLNTIKIVIYDDRNITKGEYYIYVTKTDNVSTANTNLENLAIEGAELNPEFETRKTKYNISVANDIENLNILAIPENINAKVDIEGTSNLKIGDNTVVVNVVAENGYTFRRYIINVHKRNLEEENEVHEEEEKQIQKLNSLLQKNNNDVVIEKQSNEITVRRDNENWIWILILILVVIGVIVSVIITVVQRKNK